MTASIAERLATVRADVAAACVAAGRDPAEVTLVAVSKGHPAAAIEAAFAAGQVVFGESYPLEFRNKTRQLAHLPLRWHFVGHVQRNKAKWVIGQAELLHSVSDLAGIQAFERRAEVVSWQQDVLLQVNLSGEESKRGCTRVEAPTLVEAVDASEHLRLRGLMTLPPAAGDPAPYFAQLVALRAALPRPERLDVMSMGMTADFREAIAQGATHVRVGTAIFGPRPPKSSDAG